MKSRNSPGVIALVLLLASCATPPVQETGVFEKAFSFSILEDYDKGDDLDQVAADFRLFRELGITTWRGSFGWDDYEPNPGEYDFAWLHRFAALAADFRIDLRPYIAYTPAWAAQGGGDDAPWNDPPADIGKWQRFVSRLASAMRRHDNVLSFEIYNEENAALWWDGSADEYVDVLTAGSEAVRAAGGDDRVLFGGLTYPDLEWLEQTCSDPGVDSAFDILPIHAYPETWPAEDPLESYLDPAPTGYFHGTFLAGADGLCGRKPIWINEAGFATTPGKRSERDQANWWVRAIATFAANPRIEHVGVYEIKDRPRAADVIGDPENYYLGLTYPDRTRKLAFTTVKRLVDLLNTGTITVADKLLDVEVVKGKAGQLYRHLFIRPDGTQVLILWDKEGSPRVRFTLARAGSEVTEYNLDGTARAPVAFDDWRRRGIRLQPGETRIFAVTP